MTTWLCFWKGWKAAARLWPVVLLLWLVDLGLALVLAIPPATGLAELFGHSTMAPELLGPLTLNLVVEMSDGGQGFPLPWPLYLLVPVPALLVGTFLRGGTLRALAARPEDFRWAAFFSDSARFFPRLLLLLLFYVPGLVVVALLFLLLLGLLRFSALGTWAAAAILLAFLLFLLLAALDYACISLVLEPERSVPRHAGRSLRFMARRFPQVVILGLGFVLAGLLIALAYPLLVQLSPLFGAFASGLIAQQAVALLGSWQRVASLGGEMALFRAMGTAGDARGRRQTA